MRTHYLAACMLLLCACSNYRKTFEGTEPKVCRKDVKSIVTVTPGIDEVFSLRVCEGFGLYTDTVNENGTVHAATQEVPIRKYYNYDKQGICTDCNLVEETYLMLDNIGDRNTMNGNVVYIPSYRTFNRYKYRTSFEVQEKDNSVYSRSGDIRQYYLDATRQVNLGVGFEVMTGVWCWKDNAKRELQIHIANESGVGYYIVMANYTGGARPTIEFTQITNPTIDKYSGAPMVKELLIDINEAIRFENDTSGLTFHNVHPSRSVVAEFPARTFTELKIQRLNNKIENKQFKRQRTCRKKRIEKLMDRVKEMESDDRRFIQALGNLYRQSGDNCYRCEGDTTERDSLHRLFVFAQWMYRHYDDDVSTVDSLVFGMYRKKWRRAKHHYLKAYCEPEISLARAVGESATSIKAAMDSLRLLLSRYDDDPSRQHWADSLKREIVDMERNWELASYHEAMEKHDAVFADAVLKELTDMSDWKRRKMVCNMITSAGGDDFSYFRRRVRYISKRPAFDLKEHRFRNNKNLKIMGG